MEVLIDNKDLKTIYGIEVLDYTEAFNFPAERINERVWNDKSGVDKNLENIRYEPREFVIVCLVKNDTLAGAYALINTLIAYMYNKGCFVLSLRNSLESIRECFLCERSNTIVGDIKVREQNSVYVFKLGLKDVNPNAVKYKTAVVYNEVTEDYELTINYSKGQTAVIYWGNGDRGYVSNSGNYFKNDFTAAGAIDVIIDVDNDSISVDPLVADFSANIVSGVKPQTVVFTDESEGDVEIWSWSFGDGNTSSEQNPTHIYNSAGSFTVILQIFNSVKGVATETKVAYITIRSSRLMINSVDSFLKNTIDKLLKN